MGEYERSDIDWADPPEPHTYSEVTPRPEGWPDGQRGPGIITPHTFVILPRPEARKGGGIWLAALIYYCRAAALRFREFREELLDMVSKLPPAKEPAAPNRLTWWKSETYSYRSALLGTHSDGVRFTIEHMPTCYRRGPYRLHIEVLLGEHHHQWGCFDAQDQPTRHYHKLEVALSEAQDIADVLWADRHGPCPVCDGKRCPTCCPEPTRKRDPVPEGCEDCAGCPDCLETVAR